MTQVSNKYMAYDQLQALNMNLIELLAARVMRNLNPGEAPFTHPGGKCVWPLDKMHQG